MEKIKAIFKNLHSRIWFIVTVSLVAVLLVANIVASTYLYTLVCTVLSSRKRPVFAEGSQAVYVAKTESKAEALEKGNALAVDICKEGMTLLKNDGGALPLAEGAKVSVFGKNSVNLVYGASGSGGVDYSKAKTLFDSLTAAGISYNPDLKAFYENNSLSGGERSANPSLDAGGSETLKTGETPWANYSDALKASFKDYNNAAIVVLSRIGGEDFDLPRTSEEEGKHYLELDANEIRLIEEVTKAGFEKTVVLVNSAATMELGFVKDDAYGKIDACLWIGAPGMNGAMAIGEILSGKVNPSGHTADTYAADFTADPTWHNFGNNRKQGGDAYTVDGKAKNYFFVDYEEGIYVGYRYYETRGYTDGEKWYDEHVVYPLGHGLSYTTFEWTVDDSALKNKTVTADASYTVKVTVKNTGARAGRDVVQLYASAPYTAGGIEKAHKVLCGFAKTELIEPGRSGEVELTFTPYDIASYDYTDANKNTFKGYELDGGNYTLYVANDAHDSSRAIPFKVADGGIKYGSDPTTGTKVENLFDDADDELSTVLSRSAWDETMPTTPSDDERARDNEFINKLNDKTSNNPDKNPAMPKTGVEYTKVDEETGEKIASPVLLKDLVGVPYDDTEKWDAFLDQLTVSEMTDLFNEGAFKTAGVLRLGIPETIESDGPVGFCNFMDKGTIYDTCAYFSEVILSSTWDIKRAEDFGKSIAEEGYWGDQRGSGLPYSGLYAPGANIHRSPFGGRNIEYFSEDGYLSGIMAAHEILGAQSGGVTMYMKHFALNEQETHRNANGVCTWATEQSMREVYFKPFELAVKVGKARGMMSSFNRIGTVWTGGDYRLITKVLRNEWGFEGCVISDFITNAYMNPKQMCYAGGDLNLTTTKYWTNVDSSSASDVTALRKAAKNILYSIANSNAMNGEIIGYKLPIWQVIMFVVDAVMAAGLAVWGVFAVRGALKAASEPTVSIEPSDDTSEEKQE